MKALRRVGLVLVISIVLVSVAGCGVQRKQHYSSSVFQYLYPDEEGYFETADVPRLSLPLRIGIAFVPEDIQSHSTLTAKDRLDLMKSVSAHFKEYDYVKSVELIPSAYLRKNGSFENLDQIRTMYGIDVIGLLSYDQVQFTDEGIASIAYWTIVGAYIIPGEKNDTHTMLDAAIYDIASRKMLFRAPGISHIKGNATPVNLSEELRLDAMKGFQEARDHLTVNLDEQLASFKEKVREAPEDYQLSYKPGYTGGGSIDLAYTVLLLISGIFMLWMKNKQKV